MQRAVGPTRTGQHGTRFVAPARSGRERHPLSRDLTRTTPCHPRAIAAAAGRDPLGAIHRAARGIAIEEALPRRGDRGPIRSSSMRWSTERRDPRTWRSRRAFPWPA